MTGITKAQSVQIQRALRETVEPALKIDGSLGNASLTAIQKFARTNGMAAPTSFEGEAFDLLTAFINKRYVNEAAFKKAALDLGVNEATVRAIAQIESRGEGFLPDGRMTILFERHWFYKKIQTALAYTETQQHVLGVLGVTVPVSEKNRSKVVLDALVERNSNICSATAGGYKGGAAEWNRLQEAAMYDSEAAYASASYGSFQIMGFNHNRCGYNKPSAMMLAFAESESTQFHGVCSFIRSDANMLNALRKRDWAAFAKSYNGPDYLKNQYDTKLANAYNSWVKQLASEAS